MNEDGEKEEHFEDEWDMLQKGFDVIGENANKAMDRAFKILGQVSPSKWESYYKYL